MKKYILLLLITLAASVHKILIDDADLIPVSNINSKTSEELRNDLYFTVCMEMIRSEEYEKIVKEFLEEVPDDVTNIEIGLEICKKLSEMEQFQQLLDEMESSKNQIKGKVLDYNSNIKTNKKLFPVIERRIVDDELELEPIQRIDREADIVLKGLFGKGFWKALFNLAVTIVEAFVPSCLLICEGVITFGNSLFDS